MMFEDGTISRRSLPRLFEFEFALNLMRGGLEELKDLLD
jgi:hypothetical protein